MRNPRLPDLFVAFDTETTGLSPVGDRVVEIAAVAFRPDGAQAAVFEQLVDPDVPIPAPMTAIHGITDAMVAGRPRIEQVLPEFFRFIGGAALVAHNAPYDVAMIMVPLVKMAASAHGAGRPRPSPPGNLVLDTCALSRAAFPGAPNYRLGTMADWLDIPRGRAHRALADVHACKGLFLKILERCGPAASLDALVRMNGSELHLGWTLAMLEAGLNAPLAAAQAALLASALRTGSAVSIEYRGGTKGAGPRLVTPITLVSQGKLTYLVAHCHLDRSLKNFRLDRIVSIRPRPGASGAPRAAG